MATPTFDLAGITLGGQPKPPRVFIYGSHGIGKTTLAAAAPAPIFLRTEDGLSTLRVPTFPRITSHGQLHQALDTLLAGGHPFQTAVLDSADWLEPIIWAHTAMLAGKDNIESVPYGKGYIQADDHWNAILAKLDRLRDAGMAVVVLAHAEVKRYDSPEVESFDRHQVKLHKRAAALWQEWADVVGFAKWEVFTRQTEVGFNQKINRGVGSGRRLLATVERPAYYAKNRYSLPPEIELSWPVLQAGIEASFAAPVPANVAWVAEPAPTAAPEPAPAAEPVPDDHEPHPLAIA